MYSYHSKEFYFAKEEFIADWSDSLCSMRSSYWIFCWKLSSLIQQKWKQQFPVYSQTPLRAIGCIQSVVKDPCMKVLQIFTLRCRTKPRSQSFTSEIMQVIYFKETSSRGIQATSRTTLPESDHTINWYSEEIFKFCWDSDQCYTMLTSQFLFSKQCFRLD